MSKGQDGESCNLHSLSLTELYQRSERTKVMDIFCGGLRLKHSIQIAVDHRRESVLVVQKKGNLHISTMMSLQ